MGAKAAPITVGSDIAGNGYEAASEIEGTIYLDGVVASASGTITTVRANFIIGSGNGFAFLTYNPTTDRVRAIGSTLTSAQSGAGTFAVSLAVQAGDLIGIWDRYGVLSVRRQSSATGYTARYTYLGATKPVPNDELGTANAASTRYAIYGTN